MTSLRFLQLSDLHLGSPLTHSKLGLSPEKQSQRQAELESLIRTLPSLVTQHNVDLVLLPGDLWDSETLTSPSQIQQFRLLYTVLVNLRVPVVITPGNHDYYSPVSFYHPEMLQAHGFPPWPDHILIFTGSTFETRWVPGYEGRVQVMGRAFQDNTEWDSNPSRKTYRILSDLPPQSATPFFNLLMFHGSRDDRGLQKRELTAPFSGEELIALNFDYAAVGHYHRFDTFKDTQDRIKGAYAGCPFGRGLDETGPKCVLVGEMAKQGAEPAHVSIAPVSVDVREIHALTLLLAGAESQEDILNHLKMDLNMQVKAQDMIYCTLTGQVAPGLTIDWEQVENALNSLFFHVKLNPEAVSQQYDLERLRQDPYSLEGRFIQAIEHQLSVASAEERIILEKALVLGLDALTGSGVLRK